MFAVGEGVGIASPLPYRRLIAGQSTSNNDIGEVLCSIVECLSLGKMTSAKIKPAKFRVRAALRFLTVRHFLAAHLSIRKFSIFMDHCYRPLVMSEVL